VEGGTRRGGQLSGPPQSAHACWAGRHTQSLPIVKKAAWPSPIHSLPLCLSLSLPYKSSHTNPRPQATQRAQLVSTSLLLCIATQHKSLSLSTALSLFSASPALRTRFFASFSRCKRLLKLLLHRDKCCACARGTFDSLHRHHSLESALWGTRLANAHPDHTQLTA
jgi:hypothetical protein